MSAREPHRHSVWTIACLSIVALSSTEALASRLYTNQYIPAGYGMSSANGRFQVTVLTGGDIAVSDHGCGSSGYISWSFETYVSGSKPLLLDEYGELHLCSESDCSSSEYEWCGGTGGQGVNYLEMRNDGSLVLATSNGSVVEELAPALQYSCPTWPAFYDKSSCSGSLQDPVNFAWNDAVYTASNAQTILMATNSCGGGLNADAICGDELVLACQATYKKPCGHRNSNYDRYHSRMWNTNPARLTPVHQDHGCNLVPIYNTSGQFVGWNPTDDGAYFNIGRAQMYWNMIIGGCRSSQFVNVGNTTSIFKDCGAGWVSSDGYAYVVH